ncbi:MAG: hypothetical protein JKY51_06460 [Opitutaceae bacterium]|nr:hypothetical protein [Opitutaceae bacterium]
MRNLVLNSNPDEMPWLKGKKVWAVMMETGFPESAYTLIASADGSASIYFSNGGGIIGAGEHENVRRRRILTRLLRVLSRLFLRTKKTLEGLWPCSLLWLGI